MDNLRFIELVLLVLCVSPDVHAYASGAADSACDDLAPSHGAAHQTTAAPYNVTVSNTTYLTGQTILVTLSGGQPFKGFLMQARSDGALNLSNPKHGTFTISASEEVNGQVKSCGTQNSVTHKDGNPKVSITVEWHPPPAPQGEIIFRATFAEEKTVFWLDVQSVRLSPLDPTATAGPTTPQPTTPETQSSLKYDPACVNEKGCFHNPGCSETSCEFIVSYQNTSTEDMEFTLTARASSNANQYMAIGFSSDKTMGDDKVISCISYSGAVDVFRSQNIGKNNELLETDPQAGLTKISGTVVDGIFSCSFTTKMAVSGNTNIPDLSEKWILFFAQGNAPSANRISHHDKTPAVSTDSVNLLQAGSQGGNVGKQKDQRLLQVHGSLMIIAWAFLPSIGIILARFYKPMWPNTKLNATAVWFQIHRGCMVMVFICNAVAFVVIFVDVGEYSSFTTSWHAGHPIMGIIATALSIANPIMSIFRCHPGTKNRPLFNWAHWAVGMSAWILGTIAIFFALRLDRVTAYINQNAIYVMAALVAYESVFIIAMDIIQCYSSKESRKKESYQMKAVGDKSDEDTSKPKPPASKLKNFLLAMHFLIMLSLSVTLIVLINLEKEETHADNGH